MTSLSASQNTSGKASKIPIATPNTNASAARDDIPTSQAMKPPFESRKSAEELKLRLASAVSAKIALSKDGRNPSANRGIGYLLQRKEQQENKLNTKDISFQKLARNEGGKAAETEPKDANSSTKNARNKAVLQKSLLSALMNSRAPSGTSAAQNRVKDSRLGTASKLSSNTTGKNSPSGSVLNKAPLPTPKATSKNVVNKPNKDASSIAVDSSKTSQSGSINSKTKPKSAKVENVVNEQKKNVIRETGTSKVVPFDSTNGKTNYGDKLTRETARNAQTEPSNGNEGGILERAKNIERLLGQRKQPILPLQQTNTTTNVPLNGKAKTTGPNKEGITNTNVKNGELKVNRTATASKQIENGKEEISIPNGGNKMANTTKELGSPTKLGDRVLNGGGFKLTKTAKTAQSFENGTNEGTASVNGEVNGKSGANKTVEAKKPVENFGKRIPPPVSKKPSKENMLQRSKQNGVARQDSAQITKGNTSSNSKPSSQNTAQLVTNGNSSRIQAKISTSKARDLNSNNESLNGTYSGKYTTFTEDLLEKLEADVASCKIAAFQSTEDFSMLRMKVYRIRGELDQLKREREKRTPLVY